MLQPSLSVRTGLLVLVVTLALVASPIASAADVSPGHEGPTATVDHRVSLGESEYAQQTTPISYNNSSVRHRNPEAVDSQNRLDDLQRVLGSRLSERLSESSVQLSQEQYDQARSVLGDEYLDQLGKYGDVAGERGDDNATSATETFTETRETQREYSQTVEEFRETVDAYQEARENGDEARARQLAREAVDLGREAARQSERLNGSYGQLEQVSGADLGDARERIQTVQTDIDEDRTEISNAEFVATTLTVRVADEEGSFTEPFELTGSIASEDGPLGPREISLEVEGQTTRVTTSANGEFSLTYRPTVVPANASNLTVRYVPQNTSVYNDSRATVPVRIEPVTADVELETVSTETSFGEPVTARGSLAVDGEPVAGLPLAVSVDGVRVGTARTTENGSFVFEGSLPANSRSGTQSLSVGPAASGRAVDVAVAQSPVQVTETPTALSATVDETTQENVTALSGTLTAAGRPVADQRIVVTVAGDRVGTARTDAQGAYVVRVDGESGLAQVTFDGEGTNLASAEASVDLPSDSDAEATTPDESNASTSGVLEGFGAAVEEFVALLRSDPLAALTTPVGLIVSSLVLGVVGLGAVGVLRRRRDTTTVTPVGAVDTTVRTTGTGSTEQTVSGPAPRDLLASAMVALEAGTTDDAVIDAYAAARRALTARLVDKRGRTHWQFFDACLAAGTDADLLRTLTEAYEAARYGSDDPSTAVAERAIAAARSLVETDGQATSAAPGDD
ncbi:DUF4129 domain-containing protein [Salinigranum halophilum]|uniref:DUF4129 domain-containing protein n=1 Tax=Salinigranum halophilum TaxID=2565931 RepID=UPI00115ECF89|nr:DUF4129 domain-containing protein [Salinigranum halophilum]